MAPEANFLVIFEALSTFSIDIFSGPLIIFSTYSRANPFNLSVNEFDLIFEKSMSSENLFTNVCNTFSIFVFSTLVFCNSSIIKVSFLILLH